MHLFKIGKKTAIVIVGIALAATVVASVEISMLYNYAYQYAHSSALSVQRTCGAVGPDGPDVDGLIGFSNPSSIAIDASWKYEFYFSNTVTPDAFGALSVHVPAHGITYTAVRFYKLATSDQFGAITTRLFKLTSYYHALYWSFDKIDETNGTMLIPFGASTVIPLC
ncbi:hypothetical protein E6H34_00080 [Candidatus Bathyarchaeota archaeon]|nr:MAG: hypothetical protein E6H34_00080 [Candidatus Bathyarchaeota archaeon]